MHDRHRYDRQMRLPGFGEAGQSRLLESTALVLGCGALGTTVADALARAGVGHLVIVDRDFVETTNLQRQVLFDEHDVAAAMPKAEAARRKIAKINSHIKVTALVDDIDYTNIERFAAGADVLVDGLDNFETRYLVNDCAVKHGIPYVYGGAVGTVGAAFAILPHTRTGDAPWERASAGGRSTPCLRCLFDEIPPPGSAPTCETAGVLGPAAAIIAQFEAAEALKILTGNYDRIARRMLNIDLWASRFDQFDVSRAYDTGECVCCKRGRFEFLDGERGSGATTLCGRDAVQLTHRHKSERLDLKDAAARLREHGPVTANEFLVRAQITDNGQSFGLTVFADGRALVSGTGDPKVARSVYAKYVGA